MGNWRGAVPVHRPWHGRWIFHPPPPLAVLRLAALGDNIAMARLLMLWVQNFDNQPGLAVPFRNLDYGALTRWLERILILDPRGEYPLYAALRFYSPIPDKSRALTMVSFLRDRFREDPARRWRWLALAAVNVRHRWQEKALALSLLDEIHAQAGQGHLPPWVRGVQLHLLREEKGLQSARQLAGGLLHNGAITDPGELAYLQNWLEKWETDAAK
ncbi:MAG: hypothetical protein H7838_01540 [Magnetococcus sp. DMHC-8]